MAYQKESSLCFRYVFFATILSVLPVNLNAMNDVIEITEDEEIIIEKNMKFFRCVFHLLSQEVDRLCKELDLFSIRTHIQNLLEKETVVSGYVLKRDYGLALENACRQAHNECPDYWNPGEEHKHRENINKAFEKAFFLAFWNPLKDHLDKQNLLAQYGPDKISDDALFSSEEMKAIFTCHVNFCKNAPDIIATALKSESTLESNNLMTGVRGLV